VTTVIFDLDGVLVDSTAVVERAWKRWAGEHGIAFEAAMLPRLHGRPGREVVREFASHLDPDAEAARLDCYETSDPAGVALMPGALECIALAGEQWAIVTSGGYELATGRMAATGIPRPPVLVTASDITQGKPHPEPYLKAAAQLGVDPAACVVVEDAPAGIEAARAAGMRVLAVATTHDREVLGRADAIYATTADVVRAWRDTRAMESRCP
jgi:sugar-phosphatase